MGGVSVKTKNSMREIPSIVLGTFIIAVSVYFFMLPLDLSVGSITALANVISKFIPLPVSVITFAFNVGLLLLGLIFVGKDFAGKTALGTVLMPVFLGAFEILFPDFQSLTGDATLDVVCYILVVSFGQAILFSHNASTGGLEVVGKLMNKYLHMDIGQALGISGMVIAACSIVCCDAKTVVISILGTYFGGMILDKFSFGMDIKRRVCIISPKTDEIVSYILHDLHSGASLYDMIGAYDNVVRREINVIVDKQEYRLLMDYIKKVDPKAFITVYAVNEIRYTPKK